MFYAAVLNRVLLSRWLMGKCEIIALIVCIALGAGSGFIWVGIIRAGIINDADVRMTLAKVRIIRPAVDSLTAKIEEYNEAKRRGNLQED